MAAFAALAAVTLAPIPARATFQMTLANGIPHTFSWNAAVDPASTTATALYYLLSKPGLSSNPLAGGTTDYIGTLTTFTEGIDGSHCFIAKASDTVSGYFDGSQVQCHSFLHYPGGGNTNSIARADGNGGQQGFNQTWNLSYFIDDDAYVTLKIYSPGVVYSSDATTGFTYPPPGTVPVTTIVDGVPRSSELADGSWKNTESWDSRNSSGTTVANGIYTAWFSAYLANGTTVYQYPFSVPVNVIRFTALNTTGISAAAPNTPGTISYTLTANAAVRIVIAKPGTLFTIDGNGDVQALKNGVIDTTTNTVINVLTPTVSAGANSSNWNGLDSLGVAVSTGLYTVGISAKDAYGNRALDLSGNNGPAQTSIPVDRIPQQTSVGGAAPNVTAVTVGGTSLNLAGGSSVNSFSTLSISLSAAAGALTTVTLTGPGGAIAGGVVSGFGTTTITYSTSAVISSTGSYSVKITPFDPSGTVPGNVSNIPFSVTAAVGPSVTAISINNTNLTLAGGTSVGPLTQIAVTLSSAGTASSLISLTGPGGAIGGGVVTVTSTGLLYSTSAVLSTTGTYTVSITPIDSNGALGPVQVTNFTVSATVSSGAGSNASFSSTAVAYPNPAKTPPATLSFTLGVASTVTIDIFTLTGRRVLHRSAAYPASANAQTFLWNLVNDAGNSVANGVYLVHATAVGSDGTTSTFKKKILVTR